jgi:membrane protein implicated in regulation of membrane protease activity
VIRVGFIEERVEAWTAGGTLSALFPATLLAALPTTAALSLRIALAAMLPGLAAALLLLVLRLWSAMRGLCDRDPHGQRRDAKRCEGDRFPVFRSHPTHSSLRLKNQKWVRAETDSV